MSNLFFLCLLGSSSPSIFRICCRSLIYRENKSDSIIESWGTPKLLPSVLLLTSQSERLFLLKTCLTHFVPQCPYMSVNFRRKYLKMGLCSNWSFSFHNASFRAAIYWKLSIIASMRCRKFNKSVLTNMFQS